MALIQRLGTGIIGIVLTAALVLPVPAASASEAATGPIAANSPTVPVSGDAAANSPTIVLTGTLFVTADDSLLPVASGPTGQRHGVAAEAEQAPVDDNSRYAVLSATGALVTISGELPESARSGDSFTGTVAVPTTVVEALPDAAASRVNAAVGEAPIAEGAPLAEQVFATAATIDLPLPIAEATLAPAPAPESNASPEPNAAPEPSTSPRPTAEVAQYAAPHNLVVVAVTPTDAISSPYTDAMISAVTTPAAGFWETTSRGLITSFTQNAAPRRLNSVNPCAVSPFTRWDEVVTFLGYSSLSAFLLGGGHHLVVVLPAGCNAKASPGVGTVGGSLGAGGLLEFVSGMGADKQTLIHELGHNLSLGHSNVDGCGAASSTATCTEREYADVYDAMSLSVLNFDTPRALNARAQIALGFITVPASRRFALVGAESQRTFSIVLNTVTSGADPITFEAVDPVSGAVLNGEYRAGEADAIYNRGVEMAFGGDRFRYLPGVRLLRGTASGGSSAFSRPSATAGVNVVAAAVGQTTRNATGSVAAVVSAGSSGSSVVVQITLTAVVSPPLPPPPPLVPASAPVYRFWSPTFSSHFYTISPAERDSVIARYPGVWSYEGPRYNAFPTQVAGTVPLYRFWSDRLRGHFYTASLEEKNTVIARWPETWSYEGVAYFVYPLDTAVANTAEVSRFWSDRFQHHFYTASTQERDDVRARYPTVWSFEGARFRVPA